MPDNKVHTPVRTKPWNFDLVSISEFGDTERQFIAARDYEGLDWHILTHLMGS